jgi:pimeloyl-ACP methyl ester carboxylesterase
MIDQQDVGANGFTFTVRTAGPADGRPVLLLHGFPQTSWCWQAQLEALGQAGYRAIAPDQRGYSPGARPLDLSHYATSHLVADVLALADALGIAQFDLIGHDWGGMVAWLTAARHGERIRSLSVVSTPHPLALRLSQLTDDPDQTVPDLFGQAEPPEQLLLGPENDGSGLRKVLTSGGLPAEAVETYVTAMRQPGALRAAINWFRAMTGDEVAHLPAVALPTLYVWSTGDATLGRTASEATAVYVSGPYTYVVLEGVSHWIPEAAPDQLNAPLLAHLAST